MSRRILTTATVDELLASGQTALQLEANDIVTALAREYAQQRGLRLIPAGSGGGGGEGHAGGGTSADQPGTAAAAETAQGAAPAPDPGAAPVPDAVIVRQAVIAALGSEPAGLDAIIARVMTP